MAIRHSMDHIVNCFLGFPDLAPPWGSFGVTDGYCPILHRSE